MTKSVRCHLCKRPVTAVRVGETDRFVVLPHMSDGSPVKFGLTCGRKTHR